MTKLNQLDSLQDGLNCVSIELLLRLDMVVIVPDIALTGRIETTRRDSEELDRRRSVDSRNEFQCLPDDAFNS